MMRTQNLIIATTRKFYCFTCLEVLH